MAKIGIIGYGIVGGATAHSLKEKNDILFYDKYKHSSNLDDVIKNSEFNFVCLPTPYKNDKIDLSIMDNALEEIIKYTDNTGKIIILKSTVVPGTTEGYSKKYPKTNFCFSPEFLREATYLEDAANPDRIVIGAGNNKIKTKVADLYKENFPNVKIFLTDAKTAEMSKYFANCLLATKVILANEIYSLCERLDIDYNLAKEIVLADKRIGKSHLEITPLRGFGGKCFPKDIVALMGKYRETGVDCSLLDAVWNKNLKIRKKQDWFEIPFVNTDDK